MLQDEEHRFVHRPRAFAVFLALAAFAAALLWPPDLFALPFFSRQVGRDCTYCHYLVPKLNDTGRSYRANGYRFPGELEWKEVKDLSTLPASVEIEVEAAYSRLKGNGTKSTTSDLKIEEAELAAGGAFGKTGRVSALATISVEQGDTATSTVLHKTFIQVNDLAGEQGEGALNLRAGQWDLGLSFLTPFGSPIANRYLAESNLNALTLDQRAVEVNGAIGLGEGRVFENRYAVGLAREDVNSADRLRGFYATYSATLFEKLSAGVLYRLGHEKNGASDVLFHKYGAGAEYQGGPFALTAAYFRSDRASKDDKDDYLGELVVKPVSRVSLGARYEYLKERGFKGVKSQSIMARYNILSNVYAQIEFRGLSDDAHISSTNEREAKLRGFLVAAF